jgi:hypothetical protein
MCKTCDETKSVDQYYRARGRLMVHCKKCSNARSYASLKAKRAAARGPPKPRGFAALPEDRQRIILDGIAANRSMMQIALEGGVHLDKLRLWKREGKIVAAPPADPAN